MTQRYHILTYGCQMNEHDSEILSGMLEEMDYKETSDIYDAELLIINTCCVRETAEQRILSKIGELKRLRMEKPELIIAICGCMVQQEGMGERLKRNFPHVSIIFGTHNMHQLPRYIVEARETGETIVDIWESEGQVVENLPAKRREGLKAQVTIMYGCNNFCSYCIVPYVRGRERSRKVEDIIGEVEELAQLGYKEILFLGQNVNSYGLDLTPGVDFADLLTAADRVAGILRIRYMTSHPKDFSQKLIDTIAASRLVCDHIHLPVQAGSNRILEKMGRGYTREAYLDLVKRIRQAMPHVALTTDIIVGFPGETEEDFAETLDLVEQVCFDNAFTFLYSKRSGTPAAELTEQIGTSEKKARFQKLLALQQRISLEINQPLQNQIVQALVEGPSKTNPEFLQGRTTSNKIVVFPGDLSLVGQEIPVKITSVQTWTLKGERVEA